MTDIAIRARQEDIAFQERLYNDPNPTPRPLHRARREWIENHLRFHVAAGSKVIEVGGWRRFYALSDDLGASTIAVDINQSFPTVSPDCAALPFEMQMRRRGLGCEDRDLALCSEVLEHVPPSQSQEMLMQLAKALRPGGTLILTTPQRFATVELVARLFKFRPVLAVARMIYGTAEELGHTNLLTKRELKRQIFKTGLQIKEERIFGFYLPVLAEFGGGIGARVLKYAGQVISRIPIVRGLIWTQAYVLSKPTQS
ncbi:MAG: methyltransferase domain-containing protein [Sphingomonadales bacterium]|nr:methyltransferase domain-containing protein [Sphingomonadales bacterium]